MEIYEQLNKQPRISYQLLTQLSLLSRKAKTHLQIKRRLMAHRDSLLVDLPIQVCALKSIIDGSMYDE
nr:hypothetical transcript [Hymenolepis microstoma]